MTAKRNMKLTTAYVLTVILCVVSGLVLYTLADIPFGFYFQTAFFTFGVLFVLVLLLTTVICLKSAKRWFNWIGLIPALLTVGVVALLLIITIDYRILYFRALPPSLSKPEWVEDLHYLAGEMARKHADLYALVSEEKMAETVAEIEENIPHMNDALIQMALFRLTALPNDCHTFPFIMFPAFDLHTFPLKVYLFPEGLYVVSAGREYRDLIGTRILRIGSTSIEDIYNKYPLLLSAENISSYRERFTYMVLMAEWLRYHDIIPDIGQADFTLLYTNGEQLVITIPAIKFYPHFLWTNYFPIENNAPPVFTNFREDYYTYRILEDRKTLYIQFNQCVDQPGRETAEQFTERMAEAVTDSDLKRCIVDLRNNDGGSPVWNALFRFLKEHQQFNQQGGLFVLIGRRTFSSAVIFATWLQLQTNALLVGEPSGQGPVFYSRPNLIDLPNSRLPFAVSGRLTIAGLPFDRRPALIPDIPVEYSVYDFLEQRDPVLDAASTYQTSGHSVIDLPERIMEKYTGRYLLNPARIMDIRREGHHLRVQLSDFLPYSGFRFQSELTPISENSFNTKITGVNIEFPAFAGDKPDKIILNWMGTREFFQAAASDYTSAFEKIELGDIGAGCALLSDQNEVYLKHDPDLERTINQLGYYYLRSGNISAAIEIFRLNTELFPDSYNVYDSYGESLMVNDQTELAIQNYRKSLELNPENKNAERVLKKLTGK